MKVVYLRSVVRTCVVISTLLLAILLNTYSVTPRAGSSAQSSAITDLEGFATYEPIKSTQSWQDSLYSPTQLQYFDNKWFIVDCWHNRVLWSDTLRLPLYKWHLLDGDLAGPHSIDYNGEYYAVEDTGRGGVRFYTFSDNKFLKAGEVYGLGKRAHRIRYDKTSDSFYVLASNSQELTRIAVEDGKFIVKYRTKLEFIDGLYSRSFTIVGDVMYILSEPGIVSLTYFRDDHIEPIKQYALSSDFYSPNDIYFDGKQYLVTGTPHAIGSSKSLEGLATMKNRADELGYVGAPYEITKIGSYYVIPEINANNRIVLLSQGHSGELAGPHVLFDSGSASAESKAQMDRLPK